MMAHAPHNDPSPLTVLAAPNTYKESLTAMEACQAIGAGVRAACPRAEVRMAPLADGGDGTIQALVDATGGRLIQTEARDPLGRAVRAPIGRLGDEATFVVEMAQASGLWMLTPAERNPLKTSTVGTGDCLRAALDRGAKRILVGIGGSATNDGGAGMARALGYGLLDADGEMLDGTGECLERVARIDASMADPRLQETEIVVMCDVDNPLTGPKGAASIYGPQKGATPEMVARLDRALKRFADIVARDLGRDILDIPGSGAAGGLGGGLVAFADGKLERGFATVAETVGLDRALRGADLVITGEGRLDGSTLHGKVPAGVALRAQTMGKATGKPIPVLAIAGSVEPGWEGLLEMGLTAAFGLTQGPVTLETAMAEAGTFLARTTEQAVRAFLARENAARLDAEREES